MDTRIVAGPLTANMTLDVVIARLSSHGAVDGILVMGSGGTDKMHPASDYDLYVLLARQPAPLYLVLTAIDGRLAEIYFNSVEVFDGYLAADEDSDTQGLDMTVVRWLQTGHITFDRSGRLAKGREKFSEGEWVRPADELARYQVWFSVNYNLRQTKRMLASPEPVYQTTVDLRLLYTIMEVWSAYFKLRDIPAMGEKGEIRYLAEHDPDYLAMFRACLSERDRTRKVDLYEQLAGHALAPMGGLWAPDATAVQFRPGTDWQPGIADEALVFWSDLVGGGSETTA
jgi:hypothetical protein